MVHGVVPAPKLRDHTMEIAARLCRLSTPVLARTKDNLNQAEDLVDRRRWLFANEPRIRSTALASDSTDICIAPPTNPRT